MPGWQGRSIERLKCSHVSVMHVMKDARKRRRMKWGRNGRYSRADSWEVDFEDVFLDVRLCCSLLFPSCLRSGRDLTDQRMVSALL